MMDLRVGTFLGTIVVLAAIAANEIAGAPSSAPALSQTPVASSSSSGRAPAVNLLGSTTKVAPSSASLMAIKSIGGSALASKGTSSSSSAAVSSQNVASSPSSAAAAAANVVSQVGHSAPFGTNLRNVVSAAASSQSASASLVDPIAVGTRIGAATKQQEAAAASSLDPLDTFDGKNPFSDESLWQIPIHLTRQLNQQDDQEPKFASSERSNSGSPALASAASIDELDDESEALELGANLPQSSSSAPTIISAATDLKTAAGYHYPSSHGGHHGHGYDEHHSPKHYADEHGHYGGYYQYASVPYPYAWDFGYRRGNPYHTIERHEHGKGPHFQTKVKWSDKYGGYGVHVWDYNHDDHHSHHYGGGHESHAPSHYSGHHGGHYGSH